MKESTFISQNEEDWNRLEDLLSKPRKDADSLLHLFEKVSGDLAYARTYYPNRSIRVYLNNLTQKVLNSIVKKKKKFRFSDIIHFYKHVLPYEMYMSRNAFYTAFAVFVIAVLIGVVSSANVPDFVNTVLGDDYVAMTNKNINEGDPMAVYKKTDQGEMFMAITVNNIRVSFLCFVLGLLGSLGTIIVLLSNGIMVGAFQYYFYKKGLFLTSFLTIWIHGTIEISSIILAGAAGIILGNGLLFPRSYGRNTSLQLSARRALRIILAIAPLFIIAGFLESFVTRLTEMPMILKVLIIMGSLIFILFVFVIYPIHYARTGQVHEFEDDIKPTLVENIHVEKYQYTSISSTMAIAFAKMRMSMGPFLYHFLLPATLVISLVLFLVLKFKIMAQIGLPEWLDIYKWESGAWPFGLAIVCCYVYLFILMIMISNEEHLTTINKLKHIKQYFIKVLPFAALFVLGYVYVVNDFMWLFFLIVPCHFIFIILEVLAQEEGLTLTVVKDKFLFSYSHWLAFLPITIGVIVFTLGIFILQRSGLTMMVADFITWHDIFGNRIADKLFVNGLLTFVFMCIPIPLLFFAYTYRYASLTSLVTAVDLKEKLKYFGEDHKVGL